MTASGAAKWAAVGDIIRIVADDETLLSFEVTDVAENTGNFLVTFLAATFMGQCQRGCYQDELGNIHSCFAVDVEHETADGLVKRWLVAMSKTLGYYDESISVASDDAEYAVLAAQVFVEAGFNIGSYEPFTDFDLVIARLNDAGDIQCTCPDGSIFYRIGGMLSLTPPEGNESPKLVRVTHKGGMRLN